MRHLARDQQVNLPFVIFVVGQTFVNLGLAERREGVQCDTVDSFAVLKKPNDVMHGNPRVLNPGLPVSDVRRPNDVSIRFRCLPHE